MSYILFSHFQLFFFELQYSHNFIEMCFLVISWKTVDNADDMETSSMYIY